LDAPAPARVQGQVVDGAREKGLPAASVQIEGTMLGAFTDQQGRFTIDNVPPGDRRLLVRRVGYVAQTVPLAVKEESGATATVVLAPSTTALNEVIVSGVAESAAGATATATTIPSLRVLKVDSTASTRRVVYQVSPGVEVTLVESPINVVERDLIANQAMKDKGADSSALAGSLSGVMLRGNAKTDRAAAPAPRAMSVMAPPPINTISWSDQNRRYTLSGPLKPSELEVIRARLMTMRR
jgi:carboxypeptidase-like protein